MSIDRRIDLNLSMPEFDSSRLQRERDNSQPRQGAPDAEAQDRFAAAMAAKRVDAQPTLGAPPSPFSLFQPAGALSHEIAGAPLEHHEEVMGDLNDGVERLMVGDGSSGNRQVRMELKDEFLPGVSVTIQELEGRLQVDFICSVEDSRRKLNCALSDMSQTLAQRLGREILMRVQTDDEEYPCLQEALGSA